jgi:hypothetical protein
MKASKFVIPVVLATTIALVTQAGAVEITAQQNDVMKALTSKG